MFNCPQAHADRTGTLREIILCSCNLNEQANICILLKHQHREFHTEMLFSECGKMKPKTYQSRAQYVCDKCNKKCKNRGGLKRHVMKIHSVSKCFSCTICPYVTDISQNFTLHLKKAHSGETSFTCKLCRYRTRFQSYFTRHLVIHTKQKLYNCSQCSFKCNREDNLIVHMKKHSNEMLKKSSPISSMLFSCPHCYYKTESNSKLTKHLVVHSSFNPYACNLCDVTFLQKCNLIAHVKSHARENISIDSEMVTLQGEEAQNRESPVNKMLVVGCSKKSHKCAKCAFASMRKHNLLRHVKLKHGKETKPVTVESLNSRLVQIQSKNALFDCNKCGYRTPNKHQFRHHLMVHSGEKPYECPHCTCTTRWPGNLRRHIRTKHPGKEIALKLFQSNTSDKLKIKVFKHPITSKSGAKPFHCNQCSYRAALKHHLTRHLNNHTRVKSFTCSHCSYSTARNHILQNHIRSVHSGEEVGENPLLQEGAKPAAAQKQIKSSPVNSKLTKFSKKSFVCNKCNYRAVSKKCLAHHLMIHSGLKPYKCPHCSHATRWLYDLKKHVNSKHSGKEIVLDDVEKIYNSPRCKVVKKQISNKHSVEKSFACDQCSYGSTNKHHLNQHSMVHASEKPYKCSHCSYESKWVKNIHKHNKLKHSDERIVLVISKEIKQSSNGYKPKLVKNRKTKNCGKNSLVCNQCGIKASSMAYLTRHLMIHAGEKPYKCDHCTFASGSKWDLQKHMKVKHRGKEIVLKPAEVMDQSNDLPESSLVESCTTKLSNRRPFSCNKCSYRAKRRHHLKYHLMTHYNDRLFKCPFCPYASKWSKLLKEHVKIVHLKEAIWSKSIEGTEQGDDFYKSTLHQSLPIDKCSGEREKKITCPHCNYQTKSASFLKQHLRFHSGEKPFTCPYASTQPSNLKTHSKNLHQEKKLQTNFMQAPRNRSKVKQSDFEGDQSFLPSTECSFSASDSSIHQSHGVSQSVKNSITSNCQNKMDKKQKIRRNKKSYNCPNCSYVCKLPQALQVHVRIQHSAVKIRRRVYSCTYNCGYKTLRCSHLNTHMLSHTGVKPYKCELCDKSFTQKGSHQRHMKAVHSPEEEFACGLCLFKTFDFTQLKIHLTTHSEEEIL